MQAKCIEPCNEVSIQNERVTKLPKWHTKIGRCFNWYFWLSNIGIDFTVQNAVKDVCGVVVARWRINCICITPKSQHMYSAMHSSLIKTVYISCAQISSSVSIRSIQSLSEQEMMRWSKRGSESGEGRNCACHKTMNNSVSRLQEKWCCCAVFFSLVDSKIENYNSHGTKDKWNWVQSSLLLHLNEITIQMYHIHWFSVVLVCGTHAHTPKYTTLNVWDGCCGGGGGDDDVGIGKGIEEHWICRSIYITAPYFRTFRPHA